VSAGLPSGGRWLAAAAITWLLIAAPFARAATPGPVKGEIESLMQAMQRSSCQFNRNGSWYSAAEARAHMMRKLAYLEDKRGGVPSTEAFIEFAATRSSLSGQAYQVRCAGSSAEPSATWLGKALQELRHRQP
jgi:hypothetical protein